MGTVRQIKDQSGATMIINQDTKGNGYSTVRLGGAAEAVAKARAIVAQKLLEVRLGSRYLDVSIPDSERLTAAQRSAGLKKDNVPSFNAVPPPQSYVAGTEDGESGLIGGQSYDPFEEMSVPDVMPDLSVMNNCIDGVSGNTRNEAYDPFAV